MISEYFTTIKKTADLVVCLVDVFPVVIYNVFVFVVCLFMWVVLRWFTALIYNLWLICSTPPTEQAPGDDPQTSELSGLFVLKPESATATKGEKWSAIKNESGSFNAKFMLGYRQLIYFN